MIHLLCGVAREEAAGRSRGNRNISFVREAVKCFRRGAGTFSRHDVLLINGEKMAILLQTNAILTSTSWVFKSKYASNLSTSTMAFVKSEKSTHHGAGTENSPHATPVRWYPNLFLFLSVGDRAGPSTAASRKFDDASPSWTRPGMFDCAPSPLICSCVEPLTSTKLAVAMPPSCIAGN